LSPSSARILCDAAEAQQYLVTTFARRIDDAMVETARVTRRWDAYLGHERDAEEEAMLKALERKEEARRAKAA
jgi:hypothetical protein